MWGVGWGGVGAGGVLARTLSHSMMLCMRGGGVLVRTPSLALREEIL